MNNQLHFLARSKTRSLARFVGLFFVAAAATSAMAAPPKATPPSYQALYVFGDSLSDTGNDIAATAPSGTPVPPPNAYWQGRFSNGPVAVEYMWRLLSRDNTAQVTPFLPAQTLANKTVNFAFGGAGTGLQNLTPNGFQVPGLLGQVNMYSATLGASKSNPNALFVVWAGANDYLQRLSSDPYKVVDNVEDAIVTLYKTGAREFLVPNLPNIGDAPLSKAQGAGALMTGFAFRHNLLLAIKLNTLSRRLPGIRITQLDVFAMGELLDRAAFIDSDVPATEFLTPGSSACLFVNPVVCPKVDQGAVPPFMYWDVLHPTTQVHGVIGSAMVLALRKR
jgi:phospholipase/lecithinase/hemolysin